MQYGGSNGGYMTEAPVRSRMHKTSQLERAAPGSRDAMHEVQHTVCVCVCVVQYARLNPARDP